ncbi:MAG: glycosyltransferase [Clostridium beijerinckii]|jgi:glycosyltransferase involved in cell wall biosynthesis|uniref:glycosyltransferase n=1 Tax=Clostridium beijerinckii TaxID=1520 RepID=UPI0014940F08|nr:glycosyltransferase [Clostridium beijerinckii]MCI1477717.1 glycosyltransferase [Clostridium beijerinckii]MCI1577967.1 glycosyltransferase [Clostridium beijerinckii]MCI1583689.1 glycosyltransferase [Clostridium beijerinckii]MCI1620622.1 glycosyltransferase [Clostridium beijerinckii]NOW87859.1 glycosyltransferase involved in cell wall biosynthesis [Clostridium beijerinckii]
MKKVLIIAYYFPPLGWSGVQRTLKFVKYLKEFEFEPVVVTVGRTKFSVIDKTLEKEIPSDIKIIRIDDIKFKDVTDRFKQEMNEYVESSFNMIDDNNIKEEYQKEIEEKFEILRNLFLLPDGNAVWANNVIKKIEDSINLSDIDVVYTTSSPYSAHIIGYHLKDKFNIPWICDFRDEWSNNPYLSLDKTSLRYKVERNIENKIVNSADKVIAITSIAARNYIENFNLDKEKVEIITNGYDEDDFTFFKNHDNINEKFKIVHNGSFYSSITPYTFLRAVINLCNKGVLKRNNFEIILNGKIDPEILKQIVDISEDIRENIIINGYLSHEQSLKIASEANLLLLVIGDSEESKSVYTGKAFEYLRLKKPIISLSPTGSLIEQLLRETASGTNVNFNHISEIEECIVHYYSKWINNDKFEVNMEVTKRYDRKVLTQKLAGLLNQFTKNKY